VLLLFLVFVIECALVLSSWFARWWFVIFFINYWCSCSLCHVLVLRFSYDLYNKNKITDCFCSLFHIPVLCFHLIFLNKKDQGKQKQENLEH
jgi:D-alanyl-lipoteichoic acid acyltransferase DltB (MBOAT superfamily)